MGKFNQALKKGIAEFAIIFGTIQISPYILPASANPTLAFIIPLIALSLGILLLYWEGD